MHLWGIDLGGTKIEGVIIDSENGNKEVSRKRVPTGSANGYDHILFQIKSLVELLKADSGLVPQAIGIGTPGTLDPSTKLLKHSNTVCMNGKPLQSDLEKLLHIPIKMANDANCFALAETMMGVVKDHIPNPKLTFGIIMGTGVGGGLVINGEVWNGRHGIGGEWGHNFLDESGGECFCGKVGCVETIIAGPSLEKYYKTISGKDLKLPEILEEHLSGENKHATETINRLLHFFGKGVGQLINVLDPEAIVIGGGVGNIDLLYTEGVQEVAKFVLNPKTETLILKPKLGDSAGVYGAAFLVA